MNAADKRANWCWRCGECLVARVTVFVVVPNGSEGTRTVSVLCLPCARVEKEAK